MINASPVMVESYQRDVASDRLEAEAVMLGDEWETCGRL